MGTIEQNKPAQKHDRLAPASFAVGLLTLFFSLISFQYLIAVNGGPEYLQSLFCGIPFALMSLITGIVFLVHARQGKTKKEWMAIAGILFPVFQRLSALSPWMEL